MSKQSNNIFKFKAQPFALSDNTENVPGYMDFQRKSSKIQATKSRNFNLKQFIFHSKEYILIIIDNINLDI